MSPKLGPEGVSDSPPGKSHKFVRANGDIFWESHNIKHSEIVTQHRIDIQKVKDAGRISQTRGDIYVGGFATTIDSGMDKKERETTVKRVKEITGREVIPY